MFLSLFFFVASNVVKCLAPEKSSHTHTPHTHTPWYAYQQLRTDMRQAKHYISVDIGSSCAYTSVCVRWSWNSRSTPQKQRMSHFPCTYTNTQAVVYTVWHTIRLYSERESSNRCTYSYTNTDKNKNQASITTKKKKMGRIGINASYKPHTNSEYSAITMLFTLNW